ncbi:extracellular solute-binding protein [Frisingicoccus sp.]|uniref:extracellular solute-binding protein n=1 Tax=Frisingicoccus sp. TaxID=1918627 RepID=UPI002E79F687|nr:extracellular solute-binding protein [Frisingicoccus sp.]MEE0753019.1 extracellular solute-binding protein [Frisingicoccus sp.]
MRYKLGCLLLAAALLLSGCASKNTGDSGDARETIMVYCWSEHMIYSGYAAYVQSQIPEADVVFVTGQNRMAYYEFMKENDKLPDILTLRRMSMIDAKSLRDSLLDLSETDVAASFNNIYLENYRFSDNTINWLPVCGEVDGYIANLDIFEQNDIPIPEDRASFDAACEALKARGIIPYSNDFGKDYTCLETLQGLSIQEFMGQDGMMWRTGYESGSLHELDEKVWPQAFERLEKQLQVWDTPEEAIHYTYNEMAEPFIAGKAALMRGTGNDLIDFKQKGMNVAMLPYFGDTKEDNWLLTYPSFNVAVSAEAAKEPKRQELCMKVLDVMFSQEAQSILAGKHNMIPYNTGVTLELDESMKNLEEYIHKNHLYLRLASAEIFSASYETVRKMISGDYDAAQACQAFNDLLNTENKVEEETALHFDSGYKNDFNNDGGNPAGSAITNTFREYFGSDIVISHGTSYSGIVYASDYTKDQIDYMITDTTIIDYTKEVSGKELRTLIETLLATGYGDLKLTNRYSLPILSGCEITVKQTGEDYQLESLTRNGQEIKDTDHFKLTYIASSYQSTPMLDKLYAQSGGASCWETTEENVQEHWRNCLLGSPDRRPVKLQEPSDYIKVLTE